MRGRLPAVEGLLHTVRVVFRLADHVRDIRTERLAVGGKPGGHHDGCRRALQRLSRVRQLQPVIIWVLRRTSASRQNGGNSESSAALCAAASTGHAIGLPPNPPIPTTMPARRGLVRKAVPGAEFPPRARRALPVA